MNFRLFQLMQILILTAVIGVSLQQKPSPGTAQAKIHSAIELLSKRLSAVDH
ncbi:MAG: hypothetical protein ACK5V3_12205 [Bdellovibrionales bacterium]